MTREQYLNLKSLLKELAIKIRNKKLAYKEAQREYTKFELENGPYYVNLYKATTDWEIERCIENYRPYSVAITNIDYSLTSLQTEYRYSHIVYSMARGKTYDQIEQPRKGNAIEKDLLQTYIKRYGYKA